ncbi:uncharacterized protein [Ptychodera flava]|uniref:uncharacterized protein n=1 Tax=Ptychodera flava TaxID=63121 RepID=UPI003969CF49
MDFEQQKILSENLEYFMNNLKAKEIIKYTKTKHPNIISEGDVWSLNVRKKDARVSYMLDLFKRATDGYNILYDVLEATNHSNTVLRTLDPNRPVRGENVQGAEGAANSSQKGSEEFTDHHAATPYPNGRPAEESTNEAGKFTLNGEATYKVHGERYSAGSQAGLSFQFQKGAEGAANSSQKGSEEFTDHHAATPYPNGRPAEESTNEAGKFTLNGEATYKVHGERYSAGSQAGLSFQFQKGSGYFGQSFARTPDVGSPGPSNWSVKHLEVRPSGISTPQIFQKKKIAQYRKSIMIVEMRDHPGKVKNSQRTRDVYPVVVKLTDEDCTLKGVEKKIAQEIGYPMKILDVNNYPIHDGPPLQV